MNKHEIKRYLEQEHKNSGKDCFKVPYKKIKQTSIPPGFLLIKEYVGIKEANEEIVYYDLFLKIKKPDRTSRLDLSVSQELIRHLIGRGGRNVEPLAKKLGAKYLHMTSKN